MRPIRLKMNAFGPYRGEVDLDFTKFGTSSIFLVTGPTGSGKTTIFDGLTYALYNHSSGKIRDIDTLKSQFATDEDLCSVELTFEMHGATYRVKRSPKQLGPGARKRVREHAANVEFYKEGELLSQGNAANQDIVDLLGLTVQQFRQIVLLPQGEFRRLLMSGSREKEDIFRYIFGTEDLQRFQELLKVKRRELRKDYQAFETKLEQSLSSIEDETVQAYEEDGVQVLADAIERKDYELILTVLDKIIDHNNQQLTSLKKELQLLDQNEKTLQTLHHLVTEQRALTSKSEILTEQAQEIEAAKEALELNRKAAEVAAEHKRLAVFQNDISNIEQTLLVKNKEELENKNQLAELQTKEKEIKEEEAKLDDIRATISRLEKEQEQFAEIERKEGAIKVSEKSVQELERALEAVRTEAQRLAEEIKILQVNIKQLAVWREDLESERKEREQVKETHDQVQRQVAILEKIVELQGQLAGFIEEEKAASEEFLNTQEAYEKARQQYFGNLAGVLATELTSSEPCPVCGSTDHPNPTSNNSDAVSEEELERCEQAKNEAQKVHTAINAKVSQTADLLKEQQELLDETEITGSIDDGYPSVLAAKKAEAEAHQKELTTIDERITTLNQQLEQEEKWRESLEAAQTALQDNKIEHSALENKIKVEKDKIAENLQEIQAITEKLTHESREIVQAEIDKQQAIIKEIQAAAAKIRDELQEKTQIATAITTTIKHLETQLADTKEKMQEQAAVVEELLKRHKMDEDFAKYLLAADQIKKLELEISTYTEEKAHTIRQLEIIEKQLSEYDKADIKEPVELEAALADLAEQKMMLTEKHDRLLRVLSNHEMSYREIKNNYTESKSVLKPLEIYEELAEVADGTTSRTSYVSFERYVLSIYFDEVLLAANQRFERMTNSRYELIRREEKTKGQGAEGLEIDIFDRYSGKQRSVKTLSGGETFKASLALALGLSDVIQSQQGGVQVDTLFIDEGFGTLDADSLEMAIETLMDLQTSGRLIGIISHVDELKDRIPARIAVEKVKEGSHARIEVE